MQISVKSFGDVRLYFSSKGKRVKKANNCRRGIPLFCERDIARRVQARSCLPATGDRRYQPASDASAAATLALTAVPVITSTSN